MIDEDADGPTRQAAIERSERSAGFRQRIGELRHRKVLKVAGTYSLVLWFGVQACDVLFPLLHVADSLLREVVFWGVLGLPIVMVLSWLFRATPNGVEWDRPSPDGTETTPMDVLVNLSLIGASALLASLLVVMVVSDEQADQAGPAVEDVASPRVEAG